MTHWKMLAAIGAVLLVGTVNPVAAQECTAAKPADELDDNEIDALYDCIKDQLVEGYQSGDNEVAQDYRNWGAASVSPRAPGPHGDRFLMTFVNAVGHDEYVKFAEEGAKMPEGTVIAKESFKLNKENKVQRGPLFIMTKMADGAVAETGDWVYAGVQPNGKAMNFKQSFCHDCHAAFEGQDALGYPDPDVRAASPQ